MENISMLDIAKAFKAIAQKLGLRTSLRTETCHGSGNKKELYYRLHVKRATRPNHGLYTVIKIYLNGDVSFRSVLSNEVKHFDLSTIDFETELKKEVESWKQSPLSNLKR